MYLPYQSNVRDRCQAHVKIVCLPLPIKRLAPDNEQGVCFAYIHVYAVMGFRLQFG